MYLSVGVLPPIIDFDLIKSVLISFAPDVDRK